MEWITTAELAISGRHLTPRRPESLADSDESLETRCIDAVCNTFCDRQRLYKDAP